MSLENQIGMIPESVSKQGMVMAPPYAKGAIETNRALRNSEDSLNWWTETIRSKFENLRGDLGKNPDISIIIPAHNEEKFVLQLLSSISEQRIDKKIEVIMEVNNSTDKTTELCQACGVVVDNYYSSNSSPVAYARQRGLEIAKGELIVSLDADMVCESDKYLENLTKPLFENENMVLTCGGIKHYDGKWLLMLNPVEMVLRRRRIYKRKEVVGIGFSNIAFKREAALKVGGWPQEPISEDIGLIENMMNIGKVEVIKKATMRASGRRQMRSLKDQIIEAKRGGNHFFDKNGNLKIVR